MKLRCMQQMYSHKCCLIKMKKKLTLKTSLPTHIKKIEVIVAPLETISVIQYILLVERSLSDVEDQSKHF